MKYELFKIYKNIALPKREIRKVLIKPPWDNYYHEFKLSHWIKKMWYCYGIDLKNRRLGSISLAQVWLNGSGLDNEIRWYLNKPILNWHVGPVYASYLDWGPFQSENRYPGRGVYPGSKEKFESLILQLDDFINKNIDDMIERYKND